MDAGSADVALRVEPPRTAATLHRDKFQFRAPTASAAPVKQVHVASLMQPAESDLVAGGQDPVAADQAADDQQSISAGQDSVSNDQDTLGAIPASGWWNESFDDVFAGLVTQEFPSDVDFLLQPDDDARTAIYDIAARAVYLPNGRKLEAHSGLGDLRDSPDHAHIRMRGPTPPNVYKLTMRKKLFHGVRAIRLNPVNENLMFGRDGMLAHSFLHGPSGQSNGCVAFRNYPEFLNAFLNGEITRLIVVDRLETAPDPKVASEEPPEASGSGSAADPSDRAGQYAAAAPAN
ncbi:MAG: DUF2778 domain-containing protein [Bradyrhizobiaceae bacterium]|nr:DUF2778 domain-containing protein [Bradyrhizobiaceae bacterium]